MLTIRLGSRVRITLLALLGAGALPMVHAGCGGISAQALCEKVCDCAGCNASERQSCEAGFADTQKIAGDKGCSDQYDAYKSCFDTHFQCVGGEVDAQACATESDALTKCTGGGTTVPGATDYCTEYETKADACCNVLTDADARQSCIDDIAKAIDAIRNDPSGQSACKAALPQVTCGGGGSGGSGGGGFGGGGFGGSDGFGGSGGSDSGFGCYDCACSLDSPCLAVCDPTNPDVLNFCTNGDTNGSMCAACVQENCGVWSLSDCY
jgi:hypothetical protein